MRNPARLACRNKRRYAALVTNRDTVLAGTGPFVTGDRALDFCSSEFNKQLAIKRPFGHLDFAFRRAILVAGYKGGIQRSDAVILTL